MAEKWFLDLGKQISNNLAKQTAIGDEASQLQLEAQELENRLLAQAENERLLQIKQQQDKGHIEESKKAVVSAERALKAKRDEQARVEAVSSAHESVAAITDPTMTCRLLANSNTNFRVPLEDFRWSARPWKRNRSAELTMA